MANVSIWEFIVGFLYILGGLGIFLFGMRVMSEGIQKVAGEGMRRIMATMTQNRFFWSSYRGVGYLPGSIIICYYCYGSKFRECTTPYTYGIHWSDYGGQLGNHFNRVDYCHNREI